MERMRLAVATDDGRHFMDRHFGDAAFYEIFEFSETGYEAVGRVTNNLDKEEGHADPRKARGIAGILKEQLVQVAAARIFGPNIKRICKQFVCILTGHEKIDDALGMLVARYPEISAEFAKGEERGFLDWRD
jgi:predicted Fe-Mo cluster-binding NifX family protein